MAKKIGEILGSVRFWGITVIALAAVLQGQDLLVVVQVWLAAVVGVGTLDSVASRIGGK